MNIDFSEAQRLLDEANGLFPVFLAFATIGAIALVTSAATAGNYKRSIVLSTLAVGLILLGTSLPVATSSSSLSSEAKETASEAIVEAAKDTYGIRLDTANGVDLLWKVEERATSGAWRHLVSNDAPEERKVYGSTKVNGVDGKPIQLTLVGQNGEFELIETIQKALPKK
jgi:hypothetical protein